MATKEWNGDSVPRAQVTTLTPSSVETGDAFTATINRKDVTVVATDNTVANVTALLAAAIDASTIPEFEEVAVVDLGTHVELTANTAGQPFTVTASTSNDAGGSVVAVETTKGVAPRDEVQELALIGSYSGGNVTLVIDLGSGDETTGTINHNGTAADVQTELEGLTSGAAGDFVVTGGPWPSLPIFVQFTGTYAATAVNPIRINGSALVGNADLEIAEVQKGRGLSNEVQEIDFRTATAGTFTLRLGTEETSALSFASTAAQIQTALEGLGEIGSGNVLVYGGDGSTANEQIWWVVFTGALAGVNITELVADITLVAGGGGTVLPAFANPITVLQAGGEAAADDFQLIDLGDATAGTFNLSNANGTTGEIAIVGDGTEAGSVANLIETALEGLSGFAVGDIIVRPDNANTDMQGVAFVQFRGLLSDTDVDGLGMSVAGLTGESGAGVTEVSKGAGSVNEKQSIKVFGTGGTFTLTISPDTTSVIAFGAAASVVKTRLEADLTSITAVTVTGTGTPEDPYIVEWTDPGSEDIVLLTYDASSLTGGDGISTEVVAAVTGVNEVQTITINAAVTSGTWTAAFRDVTTGNIDYNETSANVDGDLTGLSTIDAISVTGSAGGPYTVEFDSALLEELDVELIVVDGTNLVGGAGAEGLAVATTTASAGPNHVDDPDNYNPVGLPANADDLFIRHGAALLWALDALSAVTLNSLEAPLSGPIIGLKQLTDSGYVQYRPRHLEVGVNPGKLIIGNRDGDGSERVRINVGSVEMDAVVVDSGTSDEPGQPAVVLLGTHADNKLLQLEGEVGVALLPGETSTIKTIIQRGGQLELGTVSVTTIEHTEGELLAYNVTMTSGSLQIG